MANYRRGPHLPIVSINIRVINVSAMSGSSSFNVGDFAVIDPISSQNVSNFKTRTSTTQRGGTGAFNTGNNARINNPFNRFLEFGD